MRAKSKRKKVIFSSALPDRNLRRRLLGKLSSLNMDADSLAEAVERSPRLHDEVAAATINVLPTTSTGIVESKNNINDNIREVPAVPALFTSPPPFRDDLVTKSSVDQDQTVDQCLPYLAGRTDPEKTLFDFSPHGVARLEREEHIRFLKAALEHARYIPYDAQRPWCVYWTLTGLSLLGEDVSEYQQRVMETFSPAQNATGGFGGGHGQKSHCAPSYAVILSLAQVGGPQALEMVDRRALWRWLGEVKQADGGFRMCIGGEEDVRGAYCSMVMISLLNIPLELPPNAPARAYGLTSFVDGLPEYLSRCQTFEGGISGGPQMEAHGGYAFCALACLCILGPPHVMIPRYLDSPLFISWLSARQYAPEGGFSGRTNKLVDGCYSHWVGSCWPLVEAAMRPPSSIASNEAPPSTSFYNQEGLIRYILSCCQAEDGGLRDKPPMYADAYHSCYALVGLSAAQHRNWFQLADNEWSPADYHGPLDAPFGWRSTEKVSEITGNAGDEVYDADDRVNPIHPIYVIPWAAVKESHAHFSKKVGF